MKFPAFIIAAMMFALQYSNAQTSTVAYDSLLAKKLYADDYGMKNYVLVLIKSGTNTTKNKKEIDSLFRGHMNNIIHLADEGKLAMAGPFGKNDSYRGLFIFNVATIEEAKKLCDSDPAIKANLLAVDLYPWYGSAALMEVNRIHKTIQKKSH